MLKTNYLFHYLWKKYREKGKGVYTLIMIGDLGYNAYRTYTKGDKEFTIFTKPNFLICSLPEEVSNANN